MSAGNPLEVSTPQPTPLNPTSSAYDLTHAERDRVTSTSPTINTTNTNNGTVAKPLPVSPHHIHPEAVQNVFQELDNKTFSWFHIKTVIIAGMGFFCDSYDLFAISLVTKTIGRIYYPDTSYNCIPCPAGSTTCPSFSSHCMTLLQQLDIMNSANAFIAPYDKFGTGWGPVGPNDVSAGVGPSGDDNMWRQVLEHRPSNIPPNTNNALLAVALCGTLAGQLLFGYLGDRYGRRAVFAFTLYIMVTACAAQAFSFGSSATGVIATLCFFRFCLGMGVGGDYPLAATLMSEYSPRHNRGAFVASVFAMQGIGYLAAATVAIIFSSIWYAAPNTANPDHLWRIILAFACIPTAATIYARLHLPETPRYTMFVNNNATQLVEDMNFILAADRARALGQPVPVQLPTSLAGTQVVAAPPVILPTTKMDYRGFFSKYWITLIGTAGAWFFVDVAYYSQNLTQPNVFTTVGWLPSSVSMNIAGEAFRVARAQAIVALSSTVPGYWFTVFTIEYLGRRNIQFMGFFLMTLFMAILAGDYTNLTTSHVPSFVAIYCLTFFFSNWGPNSTTFILPAECYPTRYRTTGHGFSAACGKAGAIIGTFGFSTMQTNVGLQQALGLLTAVNAMGFLVTFLVPETKGKSLEEIADDRIIASKTKSLKEDTEDVTERV